MTKDEKALKYILSLFVSDSMIREVLKRPFIKKGDIYATNAFTGVRIHNPSKALLESYEEISEFDDIEKIFDPHEGVDQDPLRFMIQVHDILAISAEAERRKKIITIKEGECMTCWGSGSCDCDCDNEHDCGKCDGSGHQDITIYSNLKVDHQNQQYVFDDSKMYRRVNLDYLYLVALSALALGETEILITYREDKKNFLATIENITFLIMGMSE